MRLTAVTIRDFKRIKEVALTPGERGLCIVAGKNRQGKTSSIHALTYAFGGGKHRPDAPVREGADAAEVQVELDGGAVTIRRRVTAAGRETLEVTERGLRRHSPQQLLDRLVGERFLDPLEFARLCGTPEGRRRQRTMLLQVLGLGAELDALEADEKRAELDRRDAGRDLDKQRAASSKLAPLGAPPEKPPPAVDTAALRADLARAQETRAAQALQRQALQTARTTLSERTQARQRAEEHVAEIREQLRRAEATLASALQAEVTAHEAETTQAAAVAALAGREPDTFVLDMELSDADATNERRTKLLAAREQYDRDVAARAESQAELTRLETEWREHDTRLKALRQRRVDAVQAAELPVPGLGISPEERDDAGKVTRESVVTFNGLPLSVASGREQLLVSLAIAAALRPELRAIWCDGGAELDDDGLGAVAEFAEEKDLLVILTRVGAGDDGAIIIEDGGVK